MPLPRRKDVISSPAICVMEETPVRWSPRGRW